MLRIPHSAVDSWGSTVLTKYADDTGFTGPHGRPHFRAEQTAPHSERHTILLTTIGDLAAARSREQIVMALRRSARTIVGADGITIIRREGARVHYITEDAVSALWTGQDFPVEACISGIAMLENRPVIIPDIENDPRVPIEAYRPTFVRSMAMFPIGQAPPRWAMGAYWATRGTPDAEAIMLLGSLARAAGSCFDAVERQG